MSKILWIMNKYAGKEKAEKYYPFFLKFVQDEMNAKGHQLNFVFFSNLFVPFTLSKGDFFYNSDNYSNLSKKQLQNEAIRIEKEYSITFKQSYFPDLIQTSKKINARDITLNEKEFNDLDYLIPRFMFLEDLILSHSCDVIFSDCSPEAEMEFGRVIGNKYKKIILKAYEGGALGRTVFLQHFEFGHDRLVEAPYNNKFTYHDAEGFCDDFIRNKRLPYTFPEKYVEKRSIIQLLTDGYKEKSIFNFNFWLINYSYSFFKNILFSFYLWFEENIIKQLIHDKYVPEVPYFFIGFHLNQESTMVLRSMPYVNQISLVEMISRVLPYGYYLYVRGHPHWPKTFAASYLYRVKKFPNVRLISDKISIHEIIQNSKGVLTYNSTTAIESLIYGKPVLSFASNIYYKHHPGVDFCSNLYELGAKLSMLVNREVLRTDTYKYLSKIMNVSIDLELGSYYILSEEDAKEKAERLARFLILSINWCKIN